VQNNVETDIQPLEMASLANFARQIKQEDIKMYMVPGEGKYISGISYFIPFQESMNEMIDEIFFDDGDIKVAVLNGNGAKGVASKVASSLEIQGFKVVTIANADSFDYDTTTIIYPKGKKMMRKKLQKSLTKSGCRKKMRIALSFPQ
jgi:hypothetical protein